MARPTPVSERRSAPSGPAELARARAVLSAGPVADAYASFRLARDLLSDDDAAPRLTLAATLGAADAAWAAGDRNTCLAELGPATDLADATPDPAAGLLTDHLTGLRALLEGRTADATTALRRVIARGASGHRPRHLHRAAVAALVLGDTGTAGQIGARALAAARAHGDDDLVAEALEYLAYAEMRAGQHARARAHADAGLRAAVLAGQHNTAAHHRAVLALTASVEGDTGEVADRAAEALTVARRHGLAQTRTLAEWALARADLGRGRAEDAASRLAGLVSARPGGGHFAIRPLLMPQFVEAAVIAGQARAALPVVQEIEIWTDLGIDAGAAAQLARCRALLAAHDGNDDAAARLWARALELHGDGGDGFERATTQLLYGKWLRRRRRPSAARVQLREALHAYERHGATAWAAQAADELRATGEPAGATSSAATPALARLTPHQLRIARYVADGATNREVARRLSVSVRTVDHHLRNIFVTLGVRSRVELTRVVVG
ncbi:helix-turn-helix transcriptional regulator [Myceligenerans crystallogenes]|uniref:HTH luxR-type domain-containing protein n=1 Tax=Myceligenerans crystallogenes TaxID=316335 RepID=A0ABN2NAE2_9MICO